MKEIIILLFVSSVLLILTACGGSGGGGTVADEGDSTGVWDNSTWDGQETWAD